MSSAQSTFKKFFAVLAIAIVQMLMFGTPSYAQVITSSPSALALTVAQGGTVSGTLSLSKTGTDVHSYYISTNQGWIWLNPAYGSTQTISTETDLLTVTVNTSAMGLIPGSYSAVVYLGQTGPGVSTVVKVPVSLTVTAAGTTPPPPPPSTTPPPPPPSTTPPPPPPPTATPPPPPPTGSLTSKMLAFPSSLSLSAPKGTNPSGTVSLQKAGSTIHSYSISTNQNWIWLNPPYGSTQTIGSEIDQLTVTVNTSALNVGTYSAVVYLMESGPDIATTNLIVPVTVTVTATGTTPPPPPPSTTPPPPPPSTTPPPPPPTSTPPPPPPTSSLTTYVQSFPGALSLSAPKGTNPSGVVNLQKSGTITHSYSISTNQNWIWLNPPYGSTQTITSEIDPLTVTVNTGALNVGTYSAVVYILESGPDIAPATLRIPVSVTVTATGTTPPPPPPSTTPPPPPPTGSTTPPPPPPSTTGTGTITVSWSANQEADLAGYRIYVGTRSGSHPQMFDVGNVLSKQLTLPLGYTYFVVITAYDKVGNESSPSAELSRSVF